MLVGIFHANNIKSARVDNVAKNVNCQGVFRTSYCMDKRCQSYLFDSNCNYTNGMCIH